MTWPLRLPVITGTDDRGRPIVTYAQPGQQAPTGRPAPVATAVARPPPLGTLQPGVAPVVNQSTPGTTTR